MAYYYVFHDCGTGCENASVSTTHRLNSCSACTYTATVLRCVESAELKGYVGQLHAAFRRVSSFDIVPSILVVLVSLASKISKSPTALPAPLPHLQQQSRQCSRDADAGDTLGAHGNGQGATPELGLPQIGFQESFRLRCCTLNVCRPRSAVPKYQQIAHAIDVPVAIYAAATPTTQRQCWRRRCSECPWQRARRSC